ncbi:ZmpA/ZmpB/ZmpC family metallo-endopeptidase [Streptococcus mitis]|uniref:ZmpA/ZmpB/ZmpC family metallo-endopeptidase n=1 Tax=Streptococcus mitis TaxID=28037 RepID=UPI001C4EB516
MRKTKQQLEKITKYSIRKLTVGVGPVAIGAFLFGASTLSVDKVHANEVGGAHSVHYRYLAEQELTESEKALIHHEVPTEFQDDDILYVVYRNKATNSQQLPYTGSKELALTGLGLATASLAVFLVSKKGRKEVLGVLLIGSLGASTFVPYGTFAFENKELLSYNQTISATTHEGLAEGIIHIDGYEYIGYFKEAELHPSRPASVDQPQLPVEKQSANEIEKTEVVQERPAVTPETVVEKSVVENTVAPAVEAKPVSEKPQIRQEESLVEIPFETVTSPDANLAEGQTRIVTAGVKGQRRLVTKVSMVNGQEVREVIEDQVVQNPVSQVIAVGTKKEVELSPVPEVEPSNQAAKGTQEPGKENQALVQSELPEYHEAKGVQEVNEGEKQGEALVQPVLPEYQEAKGTQEEGKEGQSLTQTELPEYHEAKGAQEVKEGEKQGEALVQPVQEYRITEETTENDVEFNTEEVLDSTKYVGDDTVTREGVKGVQQTTTVKSGENNEVLATTTEVKTPAVSKVVKKGTKPVEGTIIETREEVIPFATKTEDDDTLKRGTTKVAQEGVDGKKQITKTYKTIRGEKTKDAPTVEEKVILQPQDKIIKNGTKGLEKPTLQWNTTDKDELKKSATAKYTLNKPVGVTIKSIKVALKNEAGEVVKEVDVPENDLQATLKDLKYYKGYTLSTTMVYDRGEGEETEKLEDKQIQLDLKKVEIKNTRRTDLIKYENGAEANESALKAVPTDLSNYYLKFTSDTDKTTLLAVKNVEETTVNGIPVYKVTAVADNLVDRGTDSTFVNEYIHYIEKPKAHVDNVYYDFKELVDAIQTNPAGEYRIGQTINARNVTPNGNSYVTSEFTGKLLSVDGKHYSISNLEHPLFDTIKNGSVKNISFENVDINVPTQDNVSTIAKVIKGTTTIENVKVTGRIIGRNNVSGFVNNLEENTKIENVAFIGKLHSTGANNQIAGIALRNYRGIVKRAYADADITGNRLRGSMLVPTIDYGMIGDHLIGQKGSLTQSVAKGTLNITNPIGAGAISSKTWPYGTVRDNVSYAKVVHGEMLFGTDDIQNEDAHPQINQLYSVAGFSEGKKSFLQYPKKQVELTKEEADAKVASYNITAVTQESELNPVDALNHEKSYANIQDYKADYAKAYANLDKFMPFYNKEYIVYQANTLPKDHALNTKEVLSVTPMKGHKFITNLDEANKIIVHYSDGTKEYLSLSASSEGLSNVKEYTVTDLGIKFTPNIVQKDHSTLIDGILAKLSPIELQSDPIYQHLGRTGNNKVNAIKNLFLEESFDYVKANLNTLVTKLVENEDHQLNNSSAAQQMILDKVEKNKAALLLGLTYLNRYYGVKFGDVNIKELMLFKPDFYGKNVSVLDRLIEIGSKENNISGSRTYDAFGEVLAKYTQSGDLNSFLDYNRQLFTNIDNMNDWFIDATKDKVYVVEKASQNPGVGEHKYRAYDNLTRGLHKKMILPLLNLDKTEMFLISTYDTMSYGTANKYNTTLEKLKSEIDLAAQRQINYLDFWHRLALDNVKNRLFKDIVYPVWEGFYVWGHGWPGWPERYGQFKNSTEVYAPIREIYGPVGEYYGDNGAVAGAYASIYDNPNDNRAKVTFVMSNMISEYGASAFTHETTHLNDRLVYFGNFGRREGTDVEAFAQGMLQSPATQGHQGEYGALGLNMAFERPNDGNQWYNTNPNDLKSREAIDNYMKGYNDTLMMLDNLEADAVLGQNSQELNNAWFKKVDKQMRGSSKNQYDNVRGLNDTEKAIQLHSVNDLVDNNFMTNRGPGNGIYKPDDFGSAYVNVPMMTGIYGGNTSEGAPGGMSFKHNTFRLWGYYGYEKGFLGYATNKYKQEAKAAGKNTLGDDFIISKISEGQFANLEQFKKAYYKEVKDKATNGLTTFEVNGTNISSYNDLLRLFKEAAAKDAATLKTEKNGNKSVSTNNVTKLKEAVYKKLLQQTDSFKTSIFK